MQDLYVIVVESNGNNFSNTLISVCYIPSCTLLSAMDGLLSQKFTPHPRMPKERHDKIDGLESQQSEKRLHILVCLQFCYMTYVQLTSKENGV